MLFVSHFPLSYVCTSKELSHVLGTEVYTGIRLVKALIRSNAFQNETNGALFYAKTDQNARLIDEGKLTT